MTIFISESLPQQPAFLYATYPAGVTVADAPASSAYSAADILQADELNGWKPVNLAGSHSLTLAFPAPFQAEFFALCGKGLSGVTLEIRGSLDGFVASDVQLLPPQQLAGTNAAWGRCDSALFNSLRYIFSNFSSDFMVKHIACGVLKPLPFLADGFCVSPLQVDGDHLVSYQGLFLGSVTQRAMRPFQLDFGQITPAEKEPFDAVMAACHQAAQGLFFVPDLGAATVHFGSIDKKYKYEPKQTTGMYTLAAIPFTARVADAL